MVNGRAGWLAVEGGGEPWRGCWRRFEEEGGNGPGPLDRYGVMIKGHFDLGVLSENIEPLVLGG